jgi:serine/threonine protein kinase
LVHRDVKPSNILIDSAGKPYVADFGLALKEEDFGRGAGFAGTPVYMSPEQARGEGHRVDGRSDIFSLGVVFYELLTGRRPFRGETPSEVMEQITSVEVRPPRQIDDRIPRDLERICLKALSKRTTERYTTANDFAEDLTHVLQKAFNTPLAPKLSDVRSASRSSTPAVETQTRISCSLLDVPLSDFLVNPLRYTTFREMLDDLFINHVSKAFRPFSYGSDWFLVCSYPFHGLVAVPLKWVGQPNQSIIDVDASWALSVTPQELEIKPGTTWEIVTKNTYSEGWGYCAFVANDPDLASLILSGPKGIALAEREGLCYRRIASEVVASNYRYKGVLRCFKDDLAGWIFVPSGKVMREEIKEHFLSKPRMLLGH